MRIGQGKTEKQLILKSPETVVEFNSLFPPLLVCIMPQDP